MSVAQKTSLVLFDIFAFLIKFKIIFYQLIVYYTPLGQTPAWSIQPLTCGETLVPTINTYEE